VGLVWRLFRTVQLAKGVVDRTVGAQARVIDVDDAAVWRLKLGGELAEGLVGIVLYDVTSFVEPAY